MMLPSRHYESEHTRFMRELLQKRPDLIDKQREGRAIWWDKRPTDAEERAWTRPGPQTRTSTTRIPEAGPRRNSPERISLPLARALRG